MKRLAQRNLQRKLDCSLPCRCMFVFHRDNFFRISISRRQTYHLPMIDSSKNWHKKVALLYLDIEIVYSVGLELVNLLIMVVDVAVDVTTAFKKIDFSFSRWTVEFLLERSRSVWEKRIANPRLRFPVDAAAFNLFCTNVVYRYCTYVLSSYYYSPVGPQWFLR